MIVQLSVKNNRLQYDVLNDVKSRQKYALLIETDVLFNIETNIINNNETTSVWNYKKIPNNLTEHIKNAIEIRDYLYLRFVHDKYKISDNKYTNKGWYKLILTEFEKYLEKI